jgi:2-C-methyl-D-erythritol 4-phosphate cytidylyltransferase
MTSAIIVAAGRGTRMGGKADKIFLTIAGKPVIAHTWAAFDRARSIDEIVLVVRPGMQAAFEAVARDFRFLKPWRIVPGGKERQDSVWNGLDALSPSAQLAAIQDAARPCTSEELIEATVEAARRTGAAVAAQRVSDTIKESDDGQTITRHPERSRLWAVQTPQTFRVEIIRRALAAVRKRGLVVTDDTAACELIAQPVTLVASEMPNPKVTVPGDLAYIELLLRSS